MIQPLILHADMVRDAKAKNEKLAKRGRGLVTWPTFQILGPPNISAMAEDTNLKFCMQIEGKG